MSTNFSGNHLKHFLWKETTRLKSGTKWDPKEQVSGALFSLWGMCADRDIFELIAAAEWWTRASPPSSPPSTLTALCEGRVRADGTALNAVNCFKRHKEGLRFKLKFLPLGWYFPKE